MYPNVAHTLISLLSCFIPPNMKCTSVIIILCVKNATCSLKRTQLLVIIHATSHCLVHWIQARATQLAPIFSPIKRFYIKLASRGLALPWSLNSIVLSTNVSLSLTLLSKPSPHLSRLSKTSLAHRPHGRPNMYMGERCKPRDPHFITNSKIF